MAYLAAVMPEYNCRPLPWWNLHHPARKSCPLTASLPVEAWMPKSRCDRSRQSGLIAHRFPPARPLLGRGEPRPRPRTSPQGSTGIPACEINHPGAAAHTRSWSAEACLGAQGNFGIHAFTGSEAISFQRSAIRGQRSAFSNLRAALFVGKLFCSGV